MDIYIWTIQLHVDWRLIVILAYIHTHINTFYLKHKNWSHRSSLFIVFLCFLFDMDVCTKRWRSASVKMIYLPWKFIHWGVYYDDFYVSTQKIEEFICTLYFDIKSRKIMNERKKKCETCLFSLTNFIDHWNVLRLLFLFLSFFLLFIQKAYSAETLTRNSPMTFFLCCSQFFFFSSCVYLMSYSD